MYRLCFQRDFTARHFLVGGDWGVENLPHEHRYRLEWELSGEMLDGHGYLVDLLEVEQALEETLSRYRDALLNDLPELSGVNPSLERFARILWERLSAALGGGASLRSTVKLWENPQAWASFGQD
jgi:6-pyruvoyltetrahydropterin/6-carboxytetrahydropterin synthase